MNSYMVFVFIPYCYQINYYQFHVITENYM